MRVQAHWSTAAMLGPCGSRRSPRGDATDVELVQAPAMAALARRPRTSRRVASAAFRSRDGGVDGVPEHVERVDVAAARHRGASGPVAGRHPVGPVGQPLGLVGQLVDRLVDARRRRRPLPLRPASATAGCSTASSSTTTCSSARPSRLSVRVAWVAWSRAERPSAPGRWASASADSSSSRPANRPRHRRPIERSATTASDGGTRGHASLGLVHVLADLVDQVRRAARRSGRGRSRSGRGRR